MVLVVLSLPACSGPATYSGSNSTASVSTQSPTSPQIIALIQGVPITRAQIESDLFERAGTQALLDLILDRQLERELTLRQQELTQSDLANEESLFVRTIDAIDADAPSYQLLENLKSSRGLGPDRYQRMIRRNATLRKLIANQAIPTQSEIQLATRIAFGPKYQIRLFVSDFQRAASALIEQLDSSSKESQRWIFADACATQSIHPSASRGGLILDLSLDDPGYPQVLTIALKDTQPGDRTRVLATDSGFVVALVESISPALEPSQQQIQSIHDQLISRKQRLEMQRLADDLVASAQVTVMDRSLNWAWSNRP